MLTTQVGYETQAAGPPGGPPNARNGHSAKTLRSDDGKLPIKVPRDRNGGFEPALVPKHQRHFDGFDDAIISLYSRGLGVREIQQHLLEIYKVEVSTALISNATEAVAEEVKDWQDRTLDPVYPIVYFDAIVVKIRAGIHKPVTRSAMELEENSSNRRGWSGLSLELLVSRGMLSPP